ncbi:dienelactone hydrolase family protein [Corynespora cassiicola Philippines]|uniref:Dienelactone hydrolase family protein n=1 Tax=Corynespora cassiicola Philippines TaxID=1448308 RepID=A0A2T2NTB9_CORCC|nr:dienelactone hydrolase family protein [Corynespora cassiicola Philippines]
MACENCKSGFKWDGKPTGSEAKLAGLDTYITGTSKSAAVLIVHDIFGWTFNNARLLADHFAKEANATVYLPDFFGGEVVGEDVLDDEEKRKAFDLPGFLARNSKDARWDSIKASAKELKSQYPKVAAMGYCYGGWGIVRLGADPTLIDAVATAHPSLVEKSEFDAVKVPIQLLAPENDHTYSPEMKEYSIKTLTDNKVPFEYIYFPGLTHGFATRGDQTDKVQKDGLEKAKRGAVNFFNEYLH